MDILLIARYLMIVQIFQDLYDNVVSGLFKYNLAIFIILLVFFSVEYFALYIWI